MHSAQLTISQCLAMGGGCLGVVVVVSLMADVAAVSTVAAASGSLVCGGCCGSCGGGSGSSGLAHQPRDGSCAVTVIIVQAELRLNHVGSRRSRPYFTQKERKKLNLKKTRKYNSKRITN